MYAGRSCQDSTQCVTQICELGVCKGRKNKDSCSKHEDCDAGLYCEQAGDFPYLSTCQNQRTSYQPCTTTEECQNYLYCWYAATGDTTKKCLPMYAQFSGTSFGWGWFSAESEANKQPTFNDFELNGRYCRSGLAYYDETIQGAKCSDTYKIMQGDRKLEFPYQCDPTDN